MSPEKILAAYNNGEVVNGKKVTQATLTSELKLRGRTDNEINGYFSPAIYNQPAGPSASGAQPAGSSQLRR